MFAMADHLEAVNDETGERFIVRGDDLDAMADELAGMVGGGCRRWLSSPRV